MIHAHFHALAALMLVTTTVGAVDQIVATDVPVAAWVKLRCVSTVSGKPDDVMEYYRVTGTVDGKDAELTSEGVETKTKYKATLRGVVIGLRLVQSYEAEELKDLPLQTVATEKLTAKSIVHDADQVQVLSGSDRGMTMEVSVWSGSGVACAGRFLSYPWGQLAIPPSAGRIDILMVKDSQTFFQFSSSIIARDVAVKVLTTEVKCVEERTTTSHYDDGKLIELAASKQLLSPLVPGNLVGYTASGVWRDLQAIKTIEIVDAELKPTRSP